MQDENAAPLTTLADKLMKEAREIADMAEDLHSRGMLAEAVAFALVAAERLRAGRALIDLAIWSKRLRQGECADEE